MAKLCLQHPFGQSHSVKFLLLATLVVSVWFFNRILHSDDHYPSTQRATKPGLSSSSWFSSSAPSCSPYSSICEFPIPPTDASDTELCARHRLEPFIQPATNDDDGPYRRKVYDLLLVNTELNMLELRLAQMHPYVDYFVILESDLTFTNKPKALHVADNWARFARFHDKMIRRTLNTTLLDVNPDDNWDAERKSRDAMFTQVVPFLVGPQAAREGDVLLVSDVDEIPKPETVHALRRCSFPARTALASAMYYYSFQWRSTEDWPHPQATFYQGKDDTVTPQSLRTGNVEHRINHAAWHCSYCMDKIELLVKKVESFSHRELDRPEFKEPKSILQRVRMGKDFYDRQDRPYDYIPENHDVPDVLKREPERWKYMLDRTPHNGNFVDYDAFFPPEKETN